MRKGGVFVSLVLLGLVVFTVAGYWTVLPNWPRAVLKAILPCLLLAGAAGCRGSEPSRRWRRTLLALFTASAAFLMAW